MEIELLLANKKPRQYNQCHSVLAEKTFDLFRLCLRMLFTFETADSTFNSSQ